MTRAHYMHIHCPNCGSRTTTETSFGRWIRNNKQLDSGDGFSVCDQDYWVHKFRTELGRDFQCLMLVEIKTMGASLTNAQRDTLHLANQLMRNRRQTPTKEVLWQAGNGIVKAKSSMNDKDVVLKALGMHVLTFSHLGPDDSEWIKWNKQNISEQQLTEILRFDLDPDTLNRMDWRSHHAQVLPHPSLPFDAESEAA